MLLATADIYAHQVQSCPILLSVCEDFMALAAAMEKTSDQDNATTLDAEIDPDITDVQSVLHA